jgi:hypothetical protein
MNVLIQGMRRSATTFLFDLLCADGRFDPYYEPLAAAKRTAVGGGSRIADEDFFEKIRSAREAYLPDAHEAGLLNWGAPTDPDREIDPDVSDEVRGYLAFLMSRSDDVLLKLVRAYNKLPVLRAIDADARIIHIVRDPRAVVTSFLFGKGRRHADAYTCADDFFDHRGDGAGPRNLQGLNIADRLIERGLVSCPADAPSYMKLLALWRFHFETTHRDSDRHTLLLRHEDLLQSPDASLDRIGKLLDRPLSDAAHAWMDQHLDPRVRIFEPDDPRWRQAFRDLGLDAVLCTAGYADLPQPHGAMG